MAVKREAYAGGRKCAYCRKLLKFPFITVWDENQEMSFGVRFCNLKHMILYYIEREID